MRRAFAVVVLMAMLGTTAACGGDDDDTAATDGGGSPTEEGTSEGDSASGEFDGVIQWGFIAERNGAYQAIGVPAYNAAMMGVSKINEEGGIEIDGKRYEVELVARDSRSEEAQASAGAIELIEEMGIKYVFGGIGKIAPLILDISETNGAMYFSSSGSAAARIDESKHLFATSPSTESRGSQTLESVRHFFPDAEKLALIYPQNATTEDISPALKESSEDFGFEVVAEEKYPEDTADLTANLTNIRSAEPDVLYSGWEGVGMGKVLTANRELNATPALFQWGVSCVDAIEAGVDIPFVGFPVAGADVVRPNSDVTREFVADYEEFTGNTDPNLFAALWNYDFLFMLRDAIEAAGTFEDVDAVQAELESMEYSGVSGDIAFDERRFADFGFEFCYYPGEGGVDALESFKGTP